MPMQRTRVREGQGPGRAELWTRVRSSYCALSTEWKGNEAFSAWMWCDLISVLTHLHSGCRVRQ